MAAGSECAYLPASCIRHGHCRPLCSSALQASSRWGLQRRRNHLAAANARDQGAIQVSPSRDHYRYSAELTIHSEDGQPFCGQTSDVLGHAAVGPLFISPLFSPSFKTDRYAVSRNTITFCFGRPGHSWLGFVKRAVNKRYQVKCTFAVSQRLGETWDPPVVIGETITADSCVQHADDVRFDYHTPPGIDITRDCWERFIILFFSLSAFSLKGDSPSTGYYKTTVIRALQQIPSLGFAEEVKKTRNYKEWSIALDS